MTASFDIRNSGFGIRLVPVCLGFLAKNKAADAKRGFRERCKLSNAGLAKA